MDHLVKIRNSVKFEPDSQWGSRNLTFLACRNVGTLCTGLDYGPLLIIHSQISSAKVDFDDCVWSTTLYDICVWWHIIVLSVVNVLSFLCIPPVYICHYFAICSSVFLQFYISAPWRYLGSLIALSYFTFGFTCKHAILPLKH